MKTILICHEGADLDQHGLTRWLASFSTLVGIIVLRETHQRTWRRIRREVERVGILRFIDVIAFRIYYKLLLSKQDRFWEKQKIKEISLFYPDVSKDVPALYTHSPNTPEVEQFIRKLVPDMMLARCKTLLKENIFSLPSKGTFVMHPGICPEYRNAHGCFWALANDDLDNVGMTLVRIDKGVDTGPIYGYYRYKYDEVNESHVVIQHQVVYENLGDLKNKLIEICNALAIPIDVSGRSSATWGQPWLTSYLKWKFKARRRNRSRKR
jgi:formyl transferase-like protein